MVRRTNLRLEPKEAMSELTKRLIAAGTDKNTRPTGVKDLGETGDVVWREPGGSVQLSMKELGGAMDGVAQDLEWLNNDVLPSIKNATYIDDNMITSRLIAANSVTGDKIVGNTITGDKIAANSIAAEKILGGAFTGKTFTGGTYTGGVFKTSEEPFTDGGVQVDASYGIRGWGPNSRWQDTTFQMRPSDGTLRLAANSYFTDPETGNGLILSPQTSRGNSAVFFGRNESVNADQAAIWRNSYSAARDQLMLRGGNGGGITVMGTLASNHIEGSLSIGGGLTVIGSDAIFAIDNVNAQRLLTRDPLTTSGASNVRWSSSNYSLYALTSSRRYKKNIVDWSPDPSAVLGLRPRQWQHDDPRHPEDIDERWHVGFVAEEVHDLGLYGLVDYEGDGAGGWRPESLNYDRFAAAHQVVLVDHEERIAALEARIDELTGETHGK